MKYVIVIADGAGDLPIAALGGKTALEAARTPHMDELARMGRMGTAVTTPPGFEAGSDVCTMDLLGYDPRKYHTGRAPLEAAAIGVEMGAHDWIFRLNLVTVGTSGADAGLMLDHSAGAISDGEARELVDALMGHWRKSEPSLAYEGRLTLTHGVSYRSILVDRTGIDCAGVVTTPPHEIPRQKWAEFLPRAKAGSGVKAEIAAKKIGRLMELSAGVLGAHPINRERVAKGKRPANMAWIWGQGTRPSMPAFATRFGVKGAMITAVDLLAGIARLIGWERLHVPGVTSYHDTDYSAQGGATIDALGRYDIVCCHVESPDEASHQGDHATKVAGIEAIDEKVVGPILRHLKSGAAGDWRMMVLPDHYTLVSTRKHDATPVPFVVAGAGRGWIGSGKAGSRFTEKQAGAGGLSIAEGQDLMGWFLGS